MFQSSKSKNDTFILIVLKNLSIGILFCWCLSYIFVVVWQRRSVLTNGSIRPPIWIPAWNMVTFWLKAPIAAISVVSQMDATRRRCLKNPLGTLYHEDKTEHENCIENCIKRACEFNFLNFMIILWIHPFWFRCGQLSVLGIVFSSLHPLPHRDHSLSKDYLDIDIYNNL